MEQFAYSFAITMMHSIWQMALLMGMYYVLTAAFSKWPPVAKRNLLLLVVAAQLLTSVISFYFIYSKPFFDYRENIQELLQSFSSTQSWLQDYSSYIFTAYLFIVSFKISRSWIGWLQFNNRYNSRLVKASVDIRLFTKAKAYHFGIRKKVQVWCSEHIKSPVTYGFLKPIILLPVSLVNQLNMQQTESLIVHELTHIKNNDYLFNWLLLLVEAIFFFNPFVKIAAQKIRIEREKNCDLQVLHFNYPAISYAETLLYIAQQQQHNYTSLPVAAVNKKTALLDRIRYFSDDKNLSKQQTRHFSLATLLVWSFVMLNLLLAGLFIKNSATGKSNVNTGFAALPVNEWNKSFSTKTFDKSVKESKNEGSEFLATGTDTEEQIVDKSIETETTNSPARLILSEPIPMPPSTPALREIGLTLTNVALEEAQPANVKEVIINEEQAGVMVTKAYRMTEVKGEWKMEPLWMMSEIKLTDSLKQVIKKDSTIINIIPTVQ
jgi:beta-lactamase regulating signal transducer with metallopeptidase domain